MAEKLTGSARTAARASSACQSAAESGAASSVARTAAGAISRERCLHRRVVEHSSEHGLVLTTTDVDEDNSVVLTLEVGS